MVLVLEVADLGDLGALEAIDLCDHRGERLRVAGVEVAPPSALGDLPERLLVDLDEGTLENRAPVGEPGRNGRVAGRTGPDRVDPDPVLDRELGRLQRGDVARIVHAVGQQDRHLGASRVSAQALDAEGETLAHGGSVLAPLGGDLDLIEDRDEVPVVEREGAQSVRVARERDEADEVVGSSRGGAPAQNERAEDPLDRVEAAHAQIVLDEVARLHRPGAVDDHGDRDPLALDHARRVPGPGSGQGDRQERRREPQERGREGGEAVAQRAGCPVDQGQARVGHGRRQARREDVDDGGEGSEEEEERIAELPVRHLRPPLPGPEREGPPPRSPRGSGARSGSSLRPRSGPGRGGRT